MPDLTSRQVHDEITRADAAGETIGDDVAAVIASWFHSPAARDEHVTRLSHGKDFDPAELLSWIDREAGQRTGDDDESTSARVELAALRAWTLARTPHIVVHTYRVDADEWEAWCERERESTDERPDAVPVEDVTILAEHAADLATYEYPGDDGYPADPAAYERVPGTDGVVVPASLVAAALDVLTSPHAFCAGSYGGDPFTPGASGAPTYWEGDGYDDEGPDAFYASRYIAPDGTAEVALAWVRGVTPEQHRAIYDAWKAYPAAR